MNKYRIVISCHPLPIFDDSILETVGEVLSRNEGVPEGTAPVAIDRENKQVVVGLRLPDQVTAVAVANVLASALKGQVARIETLPVLANILTTPPRGWLFVGIKRKAVGN